MRKVVVLSVAAIATACSGSGGGYTVDTRATPPPTTASDDADELVDADQERESGPVATAGDTEPPTALPSISVPDGQAIVDGVANSLILVLDRLDGRNSLVSYRADRTEVTTYSTDADALIWQPIWSPDGRRVAWTQTVDGNAWELVTATVDGTERTSHPLPGRPDYITYDPTTSKVLALTPSPQGFGLVIVDVRASRPFEVVDVGAPYYSDFSSSGDRVIAHVGREMRLVDVAGGTQVLDIGSTGHQTPVWHPTEELTLFTVDTSAGNSLVAHDPTSGTTDVLATFDDFVLFDLDPTGTRLAVSVVGRTDEGGINAITATADGALGPGVWTIEVADGTPRQLAVRPTVAPMWDPTGSNFLVRTTISGVGQWVVYGPEGAVARTEDLDVNASLLPAYLPFWDQYVRSQTIWAPDGRSFVHVGETESSESGVWVHDAATNGPSTFLVEGDLAFWSPT